jgi:hypothetical protein
MMGNYGLSESKRDYRDYLFLFFFKKKVKKKKREKSFLDAYWVVFSALLFFPFGFGEGKGEGVLYDYDDMMKISVYDG